MKRFFLAFFVVAAAGCAVQLPDVCREPDAGTTAGPSSGNDGPWTVRCRDYECNPSVIARSLYPDSSLKLRDANVWVYGPGGRLANIPSSGYCTYFADASSEIDGRLLFPDPFATYDIYVLANVGEVAEEYIPGTASEADGYRCVFDDYSAFSEKGFPMASKTTLVPSFSDCVLVVERLVARYDVEIVNDAVGEYSFRLNGVSVKNCARAVYPYMPESGAASAGEVVQDGDRFIRGSDDLDRCAGTLYLLENIQGTVFDASGKRNAETIGAGMDSRASYLQFEGEYRRKDDAGYRKMTCRYYFGQGREAFVERNHRTELHLHLTKDILDNDGWTVTPEDWFNNGAVRFSPSALELVPGDLPSVSVSTWDSSGKENAYVNYVLSYDAADFSGAGLSMEYRTPATSIWKTYSGQAITGPSTLRLKTSYQGRWEKGVEIEAVSGDGRATLLSGTPLSVTAAGHPYPVSIELRNADFPSSLDHQRLEFIVGYSDGSYKTVSSPSDGISVAKISGRVRIDKGTAGWSYARDGCYYDKCTVRASYTDASLTEPVTVSSDCVFSIWAIDADSPDTRFNCFQDERGSLVTTYDGSNFYVRGNDIGSNGAVLAMTGAAVSLSNGRDSKIVDVRPPDFTWTIAIKGQSSHNAFSVKGDPPTIVITKRTGTSVTGANASFIVTVRSPYRDMEGNAAAIQSFALTVL